jgi:hypothetical protein
MPFKLLVVLNDSALFVVPCSHRNLTVIQPHKSIGVDHIPTDIKRSGSSSHKNPFDSDHIPTDIQRSGSSNHKNLTDWIIYEVAKTDENDFVLTEIQHNGSFGDKNFWVSGLKI